MAHTRSQELDSRFNTLEYGFLKTQQEVQQLSATIASRDASINASINASVNVAMQSAMAEVKHELESVFASLSDNLAKLRYGVLYLDQERWQWWQWRKTSRQGYIAWTQFVVELYEHFDTDTNHLGRLTKLKQSGTVEDFIAAFERLDFRTEGMTDAFF
jgi:1-aminocyclopropane-1-carboxylate deaminase/D-cysteine desulfhydrase-like pyridoxal-dependent ACC family enzyme